MESLLDFIVNLNQLKRKDQTSAYFRFVNDSQIDLIGIRNDSDIFADAYGHGLLKWKPWGSLMIDGIPVYTGQSVYQCNILPNPPGLVSISSFGGPTWVIHGNSISDITCRGMGLDSSDHISRIGQWDTSRYGPWTLGIHAMFLPLGHTLEMTLDTFGTSLTRNQSLFMMLVACCNVVVVHWTMQCLILSHKGHLRLAARFPPCAQTRNRPVKEKDVTMNDSTFSKPWQPKASGPTEILFFMQKKHCLEPILNFLKHLQWVPKPIFTKMALEPNFTVWPRRAHALAGESSRVAPQSRGARAADFSSLKSQLVLLRPAQDDDQKLDTHTHTHIHLYTYIFDHICI